MQHIAGVYIGIVGKYVNRDHPCRWTGDRLLSTGNGRVIDALNGNGNHSRITICLAIVGFIGEGFCCGYSCGQKIIPVGIKYKGAIGIKPEQWIIRCLYQQGGERVAIGINVIFQNAIDAVLTGQKNGIFAHPVTGIGEGLRGCIAGCTHGSYSLFSKGCRRDSGFLHAGCR